MKHTIELDDSQLGLLLNVLQFSGIVLGIVTDDPDKAAKMLYNGTAALATYPPELWVDVHKALSKELKSAEFGTTVSAIPIDGDVDKDMSHVFTRGDISTVAIPDDDNLTRRKWEELEQSERDDFTEYETRKGYRHEQDPRENTN